MWRRHRYTTGPYCWPQRVSSIQERRRLPEGSVCRRCCGLAPRADVDHFDGIVAQRCNEQLIFPIKTKMIETSLNPWQRNGFGPDERPQMLRCGFDLGMDLDCESRD